MKSYKVKGNLQYNGELLAKGTVIELELEEAKPLLKDGIIVNANEEIGEEKEPETPQPGINKVSRKKEVTTGKIDVEPTKGDKPEDSGEKTDEEEISKKDATEKSPYKVLKGVEFPRGTVHKIGDIIELSDEDAAKFREGLLEKVADEDAL